VGWPYIGPVVKDSDMKVCCVAESICVEESHHMYVWITQMLVQMEPRFNLESIQIIFGDQALTNQILIDLGIQDTCILHGDYHHLINKVWPATFGNHLFQRIRGHLDQMFLGSNDEWELSYTSAKIHLLQDAKKFSALEQNTKTHHIALAGSSRKWWETFLSMVPCPPNKTIPVLLHILVLVPVGLLWSKCLSFCLGKQA
jgi:hypothetical protein